MSKALAGAVAIGAMIVALGWGASTVSAQDSEAVVKDRQATMKSQGAAMAGVKKYLDGDADQAAGTKSAEDLVKISDSLGGKFPKGTGNAEVPSSHAKPDIRGEERRQEGCCRAIRHDRQGRLRRLSRYLPPAAQLGAPAYRRSRPAGRLAAIRRHAATAVLDVAAPASHDRR